MFQTKKKQVTSVSNPATIGGFSRISRNLKSRLPQSVDPSQSTKESGEDSYTVSFIMCNHIGSMHAIYGNMDPINIPPLC